MEQTRALLCVVAANGLVALAAIAALLVITIHLSDKIGEETSCRATDRLEPDTSRTAQGFVQQNLVYKERNLECYGQCFPNRAMKDKRDLYSINTNGKFMQSVCDHVGDIAIVGAGVAGSYAAWRMRNTNMSISLYEYSDRIGGRCLTVQFPGISDVNVEMGPMTFNPKEHVLLNRTLHELGLEIVDFKLGSESSGDPLFFLRGKHLRYDQLADEAPYDLDQTSRIDPGLFNWEIFKNYTDVDSSFEGYASPPSTLYYKTRDGVPLYRQSYKSFVEKYFTTDTYHYLKDICGFDSVFHDAAAAYWLPWRDPTLPSEPYTVKTVKTGFQSIPETMVQQFLAASSRHKLHHNHHLRRITKTSDGHYVLSFQPTQTIRGITTDYMALPRVQTCAKKVLLAIPRIALEHLDWEGLNHPEIQDYIKNSLTEAKAGKMFFAYKDTWWRTLPLASSYALISTTPLRQTYDYAVSNSTGKSILNPAYSDLNTDIWRDSRNQGNHVPGVDSDESISMSSVGVLLARRMLAALYNVTLDEIQQPDYSVMSIWDQYPIGASWYTWRSGYIWEDVENRIMKPSHGDDVFIISNTFSKTANQGWVEGALEIVENTLAKYFSDI